MLFIDGIIPQTLEPQAGHAAVMVFVRDLRSDLLVDPDVRSLEISYGRLSQVQYQDAVCLFDGCHLVKWIEVESPLALVNERPYRMRRFQCLAMKLAVDLPEQKNDPFLFATGSILFI